MGIERRHPGHNANVTSTHNIDVGNGNDNDSYYPNSHKHTSSLTTTTTISPTSMMIPSMSASAHRRRARRKKMNGTHYKRGVSSCNINIINNNKINCGNLSTFSLGLWSSRALLLFVAIIYSTNFACVRYLETFCVQPPCEHDPAEASFCRFLVSASVCLPILYMNRHHRNIIAAGIEVGFWVSIHYVCQAKSLEYIGAGKCAFICALEVVTVPLFAGFFLGKPIRPMSLVSAAIALFGVAILESLIPINGILGIPMTNPAMTVAAHHHSATTTIFGIGKGDLLAMGQPLAFGYAMMRIEHHIEQFSHIPNRVLTLTAAQCITVFFFTFVWLLYDSRGSPFPDLSYMLEIHHLVTLGWTGIVTTVGAIILQGIALQKASASDAALIFSSDPVWSSLFAGWLLNESLSPTTYVGGAFILVACVVGSVSSANDAAAKEKAEKHHQQQQRGQSPLLRTLKHKYSNLSDTNNNSDDDDGYEEDDEGDAGGTMMYQYNDEESLLPLPRDFTNATATTTTTSSSTSSYLTTTTHPFDFSKKSSSVQSMNDVRQFPVSMNNGFNSSNTGMNGKYGTTPNATSSSSSSSPKGDDDFVHQYGPKVSATNYRINGAFTSNGYSHRDATISRS